MPVSVPVAFDFETDEGDRAGTVAIHRCVIGGWTARDHEAMEEHIAELEKLGVRRPPRTPMFYPASASRVTTADTIEIPGNHSSGEAEVILLPVDGTLWIGVGSDHTDRRVEAYDIVVSKQMCDKPVAPRLWRLDDVAGHWDRLVLRSHATIGGERVLYQEGEMAALMPPSELLAHYENALGHSLTDGTVLFTGTLAARGGVRPSDSFDMELHDPVRGRSIRHGYSVQRLD